MECSLMLIRMSNTGVSGVDYQLNSAVKMEHGLGHSHNGHLLTRIELWTRSITIWASLITLQSKKSTCCWMQI